MSYMCPSDPDGIFLSGDDDEVDFARSAVNVVTLADIPMVFTQRESGIKECKPGKRLSLIRPSWGKRVSEVAETADGVLALFTFKGDDLNEETANRLNSKIESIVEETSMQFLRWGDKYLLYSFKDMQNYKNFGGQFINGKFDSIGSLICKINGASFINPPPCFVEILAPAKKGAETQNALNAFLSSFSGAFTHATILESCNFSSQEDFLSSIASQSVPSVAITLLFAVKAQSLFTKAKSVLSQSPWQRVSLPEPLEEEIGFDTEYYVHTKLPLPLIGLRSGTPGSGVQITTFVEKKENYEKMVEFYQNQVDVSPVEGTTSKAGILSNKFALSPQSEFIVAFYPGLKPVKINTAYLCFEVNETDTAPTVGTVHDPDGNTIEMFSCLK